MRQNCVRISISTGEISLAEEDLLIDAHQKEGYYTVSDRGITVTLDTQLTASLIEEGCVRELVSKLQTMRKEAGFNVTDHISVTLSGSEKVVKVALDRTADIAGDTLADSITAGDPEGYIKEWDINGENVVLGVKKI